MNIEKKRIFQTLLEMNPNMKLGRMSEEESRTRFGCSTRTLQRIWCYGKGGEAAIDMDIHKWVKEGVNKKLICSRIKDKYGSAKLVFDHIWKNQQPVDQKTIVIQKSLHNDSYESSYGSSMETCLGTSRGSSNGDLSDHSAISVHSDIIVNTKRTTVDKTQKARSVHDSSTTLLLRSISDEESNDIYAAMMIVVENTGGYIKNLDMVGLESKLSCRPSLEQMSFDTGVPLTTLERVPDNMKQLNI